jgi:hypothetical protein
VCPHGQNLIATSSRLAVNALEARTLKPALSAGGLFKRLIKSLPVYMSLMPLGFSRQVVNGNPVWLPGPVFNASRCYIEYTKDDTSAWIIRKAE